MKNNRLTVNECVELRNVVERLRELASLEHACFCPFDGEGKDVKDIIRPYMSWFISQAQVIENILDSNI